MRYELVEGESLKNVIEYAGGLRYNAYMENAQIERREDGEVKYLEFSLTNVMSGSQKIELKNGDKIRIRTQNKPMEDYVAIEGGVYYGGSYDLAGNKSLQTLIDNAKPTYTAKTDFVLVERTRPDETVEVMTVPFPGVDGNPDFELEARDKVTVLSMSDYRDDL